MLKAFHKCRLDHKLIDSLHEQISLSLSTMNPNDYTFSQNSWKIEKDGDLEEIYKILQMPSSLVHINKYYI